MLELWIQETGQCLRNIFLSLVCMSDKDSSFHAGPSPDTFDRNISLLKRQFEREKTPKKQAQIYLKIRSLQDRKALYARIRFHSRPKQALEIKLFRLQEEFKRSVDLNMKIGLLLQIRRMQHDLQTQRYFEQRLASIAFD